MQKAIFSAPYEVELVEVAVPEPAAGEVLIRVDAVTLCGSDTRIWNGEKKHAMVWPTTIGHEAAGEVAALGAGVTGFEIADAVSLEPWFSCGECPHCADGDTHICDNMTLFGYQVSGGLAEFAIIPEIAVRSGQLVHNDSSIAPEIRALAEPLACVYHGHVRSRITEGGSVLIMGGGPIGLLHLDLALLAGATNVIVSEPSKRRRAFAQGRGAHHVVDPTSEDLGAIVRSSTGGKGVDSTIVCIGYAELVDQALTLTRKGGVINAFAGFGGTGRGELDLNALHYGQIDLVGNAGGTLDDYLHAVELIESGQIDLSEFVTDTFELADVSAALDRAMSGDAIKVAVRCARRDDGTGSVGA